MKKRFFTILIIAMLAISSLAYAQAPWDLVYHSFGPSITFDIPEEIPQVAANAQSAISQGQKIVLQTKADITSAKSAITSSFNDIKSGAILESSGNPGDIGASFYGKPLKNVSVKKIAKKMRKVFFTYKSRKIAAINKQIEQRNKFYIENIYAINQASKILQEKVKNDISSKIELAKACAEGDGALCGIPSTEDSGGNNEVLFAYGQTLKAFESVIRIWESVAALKAQLKAVQSMQRVTPQYDTSTTSSEDTEAYLQLPALFIHQSEQFAFAQVTYKSAAPALSNIEAAISGSNSEAMELVNRTVSASSQAKATRQPFATAQNKTQTSQLQTKKVSSSTQAVAAQKATSESAVKTGAQTSSAANKQLSSTQAVAAQTATSESAVKTGAQTSSAANKQLSSAQAVAAQKATSESAVKTGAQTSSAANKQLSSAQAVAAQTAVKKSTTVKSTSDTDIDSNITIINQTVEFVSPAEADNEHPLVAAESKLEALDSLTSVEETVDEAMSVHNMLKSLKDYKQIADQLKEMQEDYEEILQKLSRSDQCAIRYLSGYFKDPVKVWSGIYLGDNVNNHDLRTGISAWAIEAYDTAKAAETSALSTDDIAQISLDSAQKEDLLDDPDMSKAEAESQKTNVSANKSKQEEAQEEGRSSALLAWQIGAEASKMLGSEASQWGNPSGKTLIWTDTKNFYQQYLRRKYENVKTYLKSYTRDDFLALVVSKLRGEEQDISDTKYQKQLKEARDKASTELVAVRKEAASQSQYDTASKNKLEELQNKRTQLVAKMDEVNTEISNGSNEIADIRSVAEDNAAAQIDALVNAKVVYPTADETVASRSVDEQIIGVEALSGAISEATVAATDENKISAINSKISTNKTELDKYQEQLDELDEELSEAKLEAQAKVVSSRTTILDKAKALQDSLDEGIKASAQQYSEDVAKNLLDILDESAEANPLLDPTSLMRIAENAADKSLSALYAQVDAVVDKGYNQILALGDSLYDPASHPKIVAIHQQMINEIKALTVSYNAVGLVKLDDIAVYSKLLSADTSAETEGFFVGATAKARDLKAPYAIPNFNLPPVREVFHFDGTDFANVKPVIKNKKDRNITAADFLNFGGEIPLIWQYMLKDHAFIESEFELKEALDTGCVDVAFSRGGIMPCVVKNTSKILDVNSDGEFLLRDDLDVSTLPNCMLITSKNGKLYHMMFDSPVKYASTMPFGMSEEPEDPNCSYSELGMLLEADENNNLQFRKRAFETYRSLSEDTATDGKLNNNQKDEAAAANLASISRNQIGDFLYYVENEKLQRENLEEYQQKYDESMNSLKEMLQSYGFTPSEDFDLRNDADYELAVKKIKEIKEDSINKAMTPLEEVDQSDNEPVQEKVGILSKLISTMQKDNEGLLQVSPTTADDDDIDSELKKASADSAVVDKYKNSLKEQSGEYNDAEDPFCANY